MSASATPILAAAVRRIAAGEGLQEGDDVVDLLLGQAEAAHFVRIDVVLDLEARPAAAPQRLGFSVLALADGTQRASL